MLCHSLLNVCDLQMYVRNFPLSIMGLYGIEKRFGETRPHFEGLLVYKGLLGSMVSKQLLAYHNWTWRKYELLAGNDKSSTLAVIFHGFGQPFTF